MMDIEVVGRPPPENFLCHLPAIVGPDDLAKTTLILAGICQRLRFSALRLVHTYALDRKALHPTPAPLAPHHTDVSGRDPGYF